MEAYQLMQIGFYVCLAVAGIFFIGAIYLFFRFDIRSILSEKSGKRKEKAIKELLEDYRAGRTHPTGNSMKKTVETGDLKAVIKKGFVQSPEELDAPLTEEIKQKDDAVTSYARGAIRIDESIEPETLDCPTVRLDAVDSAVLVQSATIPDVENVHFEIVRKTVCRSTEEIIRPINE